MKRPILILAAAALLFLAVLAPASAESPSPWRLDVGSSGGAAPSYGAETDLLSAAGWGIGLSAEYAVTIDIPLRLELDYLNIGNSSWDSSLFRYRGFWGIKLAALSGWRFPLGPLDAELLAGGALTAARYSSLSAVTAYPSIVGKLRCTFPFQVSGLKFGAFLGLPIEYMFRGTARTISAGIEAGISIQLPGSKKP
jgi:hypothetical protein